MDILQTRIIVIVLIAVVAILANARTVELAPSTADATNRFPSVVGDPGCLDAFSALEQLLGMSANAANWPSDGVRCGTKSFGPFSEVCVHVSGCAPTSRIERVTSSMLTNMPFQTGRQMLREMKKELGGTIRAVSFEEVVSDNGRKVEVRTLRPAFLNWDIELIMSLVGEERIRFTLDMHRARSERKVQREPVAIDVEI